MSESDFEFEDNVTAHIEASLDKIRDLYRHAAGIIETIKVGEKIPATKLAEQLAEQLTERLGKDFDNGPALYPILKILFKGYPNVEIRRGAHGGIFKLAPKPIALAGETVKEIEADLISILEKEPAPIINT